MLDRHEAQSPEEQQLHAVLGEPPQDNHNVVQPRIRWHQGRVPLELSHTVLQRGTLKLDDSLEQSLDREVACVD